VRKAVIGTVMFTIAYLALVAVGRFLLHGDVFWKAGYGL
jgi:hypothetical protein